MTFPQDNTELPKDVPQVSSSCYGGKHESNFIYKEEAGEMQSQVQNIVYIERIQDKKENETMEVTIDDDAVHYSDLHVKAVVELIFWKHPEDNKMPMRYSINKIKSMALTKK